MSRKRNKQKGKIMKKQEHNNSSTSGCGNPENDCGGNCKCDDVETNTTEDGRRIFSINLGNDISEERAIEIIDNFKNERSPSEDLSHEINDLEYFNNKPLKSFSIPSCYKKHITNKKYITFISAFLLGYGTSCLIKKYKSF